MKRCRLNAITFKLKTNIMIDDKFWDDLKNGNDFIANVSNSIPVEYYQVYLNGQWIADCNDYCEAETIANANAMKGSIDIERRTD